ncbi:MFS transporter [Actinoplanes sp. NPDC051411]|uniref:MFS transporter n=1 Tax=Actinoplanes sp. NPDC051411 TaxID=3155522 RepID=UPI003445FE56
MSSRTGYQATFAVLAVGLAAYTVLQSFVLPVLTGLQGELHTTQSGVTWVLTANLLSASIFTPIMGRIGDARGKKRIFVVALVALAVGSLVAALAPNLGVMIVARVVQGMGGGVLPLSFGIIRDEFPDDRVRGAVGILAALGAAAGGLGIFLAGPIVDAFGYRWLFWLPMILMTLAAVAAAVFVPESANRTSTRISWLPAVFLSAWLVALLLALSEAPEWGWASVKVVGLLLTAVVLAGAWIVAENRAASPLIDLRMMRLTAVWTSNLTALFIGAGMYGMWAFVPELVQTPSSAGYGFGASITESGLILLPSSVTMFLLGLVAGRLAVRLGGRAVVVAGCGISAAAMTVLAFAHAQKWELYLTTAVLGVGFGLVFSAMSGLIVSAVPPAQTGVASGMNANIRTIGGSIGSALMASIVTAHLGGTGLPEASGYTAGFAVLAGGLVLASFVALLIPSVRSVSSLRDEPEHAELAIVPGGTVVGDKSE